MGNIPVVQEVVTSFQSLGDAIIVGDNESARKRWVDYSEESLIGSSCVACHHSLHGNKEEAKRAIKGTGRSTGKLLCGGGLLKNVPVFHELATAGESLGDMIGGGDDKSARKRWDTYAENSVVGSYCYAFHEVIHGHYDHTDELLVNCGKAAGAAVVTVAGAGITVASGGLAAPLGVGAGVALGAVTGAGVSVVSTASTAAIYGKKAKPGDYVGGALLGGTMGAISGGAQAKSYSNAVKRVEAAERLVDTGTDVAQHGNPKGTVVSHMYSKDGKCGSMGYNATARGKQIGATGKAAAKLGNETGPNTAFPHGTPNVDAAASQPSVQASLDLNGRAPWPIKNCAEPHALEALKTSFPKSTPGQNYTLQINGDGMPVVKVPCNNCSAMGSNYGSVPFANAKYDGMPFIDAANIKLDSAISAMSTQLLIEGVSFVGCAAVNSIQAVSADKKKSESDEEDKSDGDTGSVSGADKKKSEK